MAPLCILNPILSLLPLFRHCVCRPCLDLLYLFFKSVILHLEHLLDTCVFIEDRVFPALAFISELRLEALVLLMQLLLAALPLFINSLFFLVAQLCSELLHTCLVVLDNHFTLTAQVALMAILKSADFVLVTLYDTLDLRFEALDCLCTNLMNLLLLPLLSADFLRSDPSVLVLFELDAEAIINDLLLSFKSLVSSFDCLQKVLNFGTKILLVSQQRFNHIDLLLNPVLHL